MLVQSLCLWLCSCSVKVVTVLWLRLVPHTLWCWLAVLQLCLFVALHCCLFLTHCTHLLTRCAAPLIAASHPPPPLHTAALPLHQELYFTDACWPDFDRPHWDAAMQHYATRTRRFGRRGRADGAAAAPATSEPQDGSSRSSSSAAAASASRPRPGKAPL